MMPIPGVEDYNANFFEKHGMSIKCMTIDEIVESTKLLLNDENKRQELVANQNKYINKESSVDIVNIIKHQIEIRKEKWEKKKI